MFENPGFARAGERSFFAFDTYNIIHADVAEDVVEECVQLCMSYNDRLSRFLSESDVSRMNDAAGNWHDCGKDVWTMLQIAQALYEETDGAYNVAVGPVMDLWDFKTEPLVFPERDALARALSRADLSAVELDRMPEHDGASEAGNVQTSLDPEASGRLKAAGSELTNSLLGLETFMVKLPVGMRIDLGSIAKGYITDRAGEFLLQHGATSGFLNFGGNILVLGPKADGSAWRFGQQEPYETFGTKLWAILTATCGSFATSGGYERGVTVDGVRYHHLIDARTGYPVQNDLLTATVYAGNAMMADALSTSIFVLGADDGLKLAQELGVGALVRTEGGKVMYTQGFPFTFAS